MRPPRELLPSSVRGRSWTTGAELEGGGGRDGGARCGGVTLEAGAIVFAWAAATLALISSSLDIGLAGVGCAGEPFAPLAAGGGGVGVGVAFVFPAIARARFRASLMASALFRASATCCLMSTGAGRFFESDMMRSCALSGGCVGFWMVGVVLWVPRVNMVREAQGIDMVLQLDVCCERVVMGQGSV